MGAEAKRQSDRRKKTDPRDLDSLIKLFNRYSYPRCQHRRQAARTPHDLPPLIE